MTKNPYLPLVEGKGLVGIFTIFSMVQPTEYVVLLQNDNGDPDRLMNFTVSHIDSLQF